jgi:hypothetical protein
MLNRHVSPIHEDDQRINYALDFRRSDHDMNIKASFERNLDDIVDNCVRSSLDQVSYITHRMYRC